MCVCWGRAGGRVSAAQTGAGLRAGAVEAWRRGRPFRLRPTARVLPPSQIDLTDDYVVMALFGDGSWEGNIQRLQAPVEEGSTQLTDVQLNSEAFRDLISALDG